MREAGKWAACGSWLVACVLAVAPAAPAGPAPPGTDPVPSGPSSTAAPAAGDGRAWFGVLLGGAVDGGVRVVAVVPGGPADRAGLEPGDLILVLDDEPVTRPEVLVSHVAGKAPGDRVRVELIRAGERISRELRAARHPRPGASALARVLTVEADAPPLPVPSPLASPDAIGSFLGVELAGIPPELREHYGAPRGAGLLVARVMQGGAEGLRVGDVLTALCGQALRSPEQDNPCRSLDPLPERARVEIVRDRQAQALNLEVAERYARTATLGPADPGRAALAQRLAAAERPEALRVRLIEEEIRRLERRLADLKRELERSP